jgi:hypothetical protein
MMLNSKYYEGKERVRRAKKLYFKKICKLECKLCVFKNACSLKCEWGKKRNAEAQKHTKKDLKALFSKIKL